MYVLVCNHLATIYWLEDGCSRLGSLMPDERGSWANKSVNWGALDHASHASQVMSCNY